MSEQNSDYRILVVDDEVHLLKLANIILGRKCGYDVATAENGQQAWTYLNRDGLTEEGNVDLVLTDHDMPGGNGDELVEMIRADERLKGLPIIMASGRPENADTPGIDAFIEKPYKMADLIGLVKEYLPK